VEALWPVGCWVATSWLWDSEFVHSFLLLSTLHCARDIAAKNTHAPFLPTEHIASKTASASPHGSYITTEYKEEYRKKFKDSNKNPVWNGCPGILTTEQHLDWIQKDKKSETPQK
jgi:hypothetical protein